MKLTCVRHALIEALYRVWPICEPAYAACKTERAVLGEDADTPASVSLQQMVLLEAGLESLSIRAATADVQYEARLPEWGAERVEAPGRLVVSARDLLDALKRLECERVRLWLRDGMLLVCGIEAHRAANYELRPDDPGECGFPARWETAQLPMSWRHCILHQAVERVAFAVAKPGDSTRYSIDGIMMDGSLSHTVTLTATDGRRLARATVDDVFDASGLGCAVAPVLALRLAGGLSTGDGSSVSMGVVAGRLVCQGELGTVWGCLIGGRYPDCESVIPAADDEGCQRVALWAPTLLALVEDALAILRDCPSVVRLTFAEGHYLVEAFGPDSDVMFKGAYPLAWSGQSLTLRMDATILAEGLRAAGHGEVELVLHGETSTVMLCRSGFMYLQVPLKAE